MTGDETHLDDLLGRFVAALKDGREPDVAAELAARPDLADRIRETLVIARDIAPRRGADADLPRIPGHEIVREIGRGGMGRVYLARDLRLGRTVALKVLPRRAASERARDRFLREARAVARLDHPLIVPIHEMGDDDGHAWFSMRYVEGRTLAQALAALRAERRDAAAPAAQRSEAASLTGADFARAAGLADGAVVPEPWRTTWHAAAARAAADVADALAHAHAAGVVHRDVKPSNVMLRPDGFALLLDFGLADVEDEATLTLTRGFLGTPHYASPEQASGATESLDHRTDVFSLGATLYEALTLQLPFPGPTTHEVLRRVQTWDPEPPSRLVPSLPPDLETVVLHALEKDPARRYPSAAAFADDLRAARSGLRVRAKRAGLLERGLRRVKRGRALTELLVEQQSRNAELRSAVLRAERNEKLAGERAAEAQRAQRRAERAFRFLEETLTSADPAADGAEVRVADVLERGFARAAEAFPGDAEAIASLRVTLLKVVTELGRNAVAARLAEEGVRAAAASLGGTHLRTIQLRHLEAVAHGREGRSEHAVAAGEALLADAERALGPSHETTLDVLGDLGQFLEEAGRRDRAAAVLREAADRALRALGPDHEVTLRAQHNLGLALSWNTAAMDEAIALLRRSYEGRIRRFGERHTETQIGLINLAQTLKEAGRSDEAEPLIRRAADLARATWGADHQWTILGEHNVAGLLLDAGRLDEALAVQEDLAARARRALPESVGVRAGTLVQLARIHLRRGDATAALAAAVEAARAAEASREARWRGASALLAADALRALGRGGEARAALESAAAWLAAQDLEASGALVRALRET